MPNAYPKDLDGVDEAKPAACITACCECARHADRHEHCRVRAEACRRAEQACMDLITSLG